VPVETGELLPLKESHLEGFASYSRRGVLLQLTITLYEGIRPVSKPR